MNKLDTRPWNLGLPLMPLVLVAACGRTLPLLPGEESESDTDDDPTTVTIDPTENPDPTDDPPCQTNDDCETGFYCSETRGCVEYYDYCSDGGCCYDGCCYDGCHYYECYSDYECQEGYECNYYSCEPVPDNEVCREIPITIGDPLVMHDYEGGISLAFVDAPGPGHEIATADANALRVLGVEGETFAAEIAAVSLAVGDIDGDADEDIVVLTESALHTFVLDPDVGFAAGPVTEIGVLGFSRLTLADFDGTGTLDAFATTPEAMLQFVGVGDGTFGAASSTPNALCGVTRLPAELFPEFDGLLFGDTGQAWVADGNSEGLVQPIPIGGGYSDECSIAVGDFDGDGLADAAMLDLHGVGGVTTWWSVSSGAPNNTWNPPLYHVVADVADLDGDGHDDLVLAGNTTDATVRFGTEAQALGCYALLPLGFSPLALAIGDFDGNGFDDIVGADGQSVWIAPSSL